MYAASFDASEVRLRRLAVARTETRVLTGGGTDGYHKFVLSWQPPLLASASAVRYEVQFAHHHEDEGQPAWGQARTTRGTALLWSLLLDHVFRARVRAVGRSGALLTAGPWSEVVSTPDEATP